MDRREFLHALAAALLATSTASSTGCESLSRRTGDQADPITPLAPTGEETGTPPVDEAAVYPDLAVAHSASPALNVRSAIRLVGGIERFVKRDNTVIIKPNMTIARKPEYAVTTNPVVIGTLVKLCLEAGASDVAVMDRAGVDQRTVFDTSGIGRATEAAGGRIKIVTGKDFAGTAIPKGRLLTQWPLLKDVFEADVLINAPIAKHHNLAELTMAMKNLMGAMGGDRAVMHDDFPERVADLNTLVRPDLVVLDATRILIRNGPLGGDLADVRRKNQVIVGTNQVSVDAYGTTLFGKKPTDLPFLVTAARRGLGEIDLTKLVIATARA